MKMTSKGGNATSTQGAARGQKVVSQTGPKRDNYSDHSKAFVGRSMNDTGVTRSIQDGKVPRR